MHIRIQKQKHRIFRQIKKANHKTMETKNGEVITYHENGNIKSKEFFVDGLEHGHSTYYHENGVIRFEGEAINNFNEGIWNSYHENGVLESKGNYTKGKADGEFLYYNENSIMINKGSFKEGNLIGEWLEYYENGNIEAKKNYIDGLEHGTFMYYFEDGTIKNKLEYNNGYQTTYLGYDSSGNKTREYERLEDGTCLLSIYYFEGSETIREIEKLSDDGLTLTKKEYNEDCELLLDEVSSKDGITSQKIYYKDGKLYITINKNGDVEKNTLYYPNGNKKLESIVNKKINGWAVGPRKEYYENGNLKSEINFIDGEPDGELVEYNENGIQLNDAEIKEREKQAITDLETELEILGNHLKTSRPSYLEEMQDGLTEDEITELEKENNITLPDDIKTLYKWKNGHPDEVAMFVRTSDYSQKTFMPLDQLFSSYQNNLEQWGENDLGINFWHKGWLPLFWDFGRDICYDTTGRYTGKKGQLLNFEFDDSNRKIIAPSLLAYIKQLNVFYEKMQEEGIEEDDITEDEDYCLEEIVGYPIDFYWN